MNDSSVTKSFESDFGDAEESLLRQKQNTGDDLESEKHSIRQN
jgi:hypothetical protein